MIRDTRRAHYRNLLLILALGFLVGLAVGYVWISLCLVLSAILIGQLYQQSRLMNWLTQPSSKEPPEAAGIWGMMFDHLYHVQLKHHRKIKHYRNVINRIKNSTQALREGVILLNPEGALQWWNQAAGDLLKLQPTDEKRLLVNLVREPTFLKFYNQKKLGEGIQIKNPAMADRYLHISMTIYGKGDRLLLLRDITRIKQLEQTHQDFIANASHELKTPLTVLKGYLESILDLPSELPSNVQKAMTHMANQTERMDNLINDLLVLTKLDSETRPSARQPIAVEELLNNIAKDAQQLSKDRHRIEVLIDSDAQLLGNAKELHSAISNLVYNAVYYSPEGSHIVLKWQLAESTGLISVSDQGIGIDARHISRLTERFYRVDLGRSSDQGGTGLGLAIVKHILNQHQARLDIASIPGQGSTFTCCFPTERTLTHCTGQLKPDTFLN